MSKAALIPVPRELIKEVNRELYTFIWKGKDKIKRSALINEIEDGGQFVPMVHPFFWR